MMPSIVACTTTATRSSRPATVGVGEKLKDEYSEKTRTNTAGPVTVSHSQWLSEGPPCRGVTSRHDVEIVSGVSVIEDFC